MSHHEQSTAVLPQKYGKGPHGVGDPDDRTLRKVEVEVKIKYFCSSLKSDFIGPSIILR